MADSIDVPQDDVGRIKSGTYVTSDIGELFVSDLSKKLSQNVPGRFYVTDDCLACEACQDVAPNHFRYADNGLSFVFKQPSTPEEIKQCEEAIDHCPMEAIKDYGIN